ncbi:MAG: 2-oxoacid:acceptor oxidoreductase subunit alpha [Candidatus Altiarchaeota archaeon]
MADISIVLCGEAGQGIQTVESLIAPIMNLSGYHVFSTKEYMSRIRGGCNSTEIRVSDARVAAYVDRIDLLIPLDRQAIPHLRKRITDRTVIVGEAERIGQGGGVIDVPFSKIAEEVGGPIFANIVAVGLISSLLQVDAGIAEDYVRRFFQKKPELVEKNVEALGRGYDAGKKISSNVKFSVAKDHRVSNELIVSGSDALGLGAISGGCDFLAAYPMTPSTGVFTFMAKHAREFGIVVEQAEDEISAVNMALGAWYAGARGFVTTSGGGFALMVEGLSLAAAIETPLVVLLSQRPGPATGLPTRTEQGDLEFALHAGHGEFPRIILAPGTVEEAHELAHFAFNMADKHQSPVILLADQYLVDSYYNIPSLGSYKVERHIAETGPGYRRYEFAPSGISPRGVPGFGSGLVKVDSDEHDESARITEDGDVRKMMVEKRLRKMDGIMKDALLPRLVGPKRFRHLVVSWGSTYHPVAEAVESLGRDDVSMLHFRQVYPIHPDSVNFLAKAERIFVVENNATGQFANLLRSQTGRGITGKILKYDGLPFSVEGLAEEFGKVLKKAGNG